VRWGEILLQRLRAEPSLVQLEPDFAAPLAECIQVTPSGKPLLNAYSKMKASGAVTRSHSDRRPSGTGLADGHFLIELIVIHEKLIIIHRQVILTEKLLASPSTGREKKQAGKDQNELGIGHPLYPLLKFDILPKHLSISVGQLGRKCQGRGKRIEHAALGKTNRRRHGCS
jgi:hypothetical protein